MWANGLFFHVPRLYISVVPLLDDKTALCLPARQSCIQEILPFWPDGDFFVVLPLNIRTKCCNREWQTANSTKPDFYSLGRIHQRWKQYYWLSRMQMNWLPKREVEEVSILWVHARAVREREREGWDRGEKRRKKTENSTTAPYSKIRGEDEQDEDRLKREGMPSISKSFPLPSSSSSAWSSTSSALKVAL